MKMLVHPCTPIRGIELQKCIIVDGVHDCYCEIRDMQILFSVDGQIAVNNVENLLYRHLFWIFQRISSLFPQLVVIPSSALICFSMRWIQKLLLFVKHHLVRSSFSCHF